MKIERSGVVIARDIEVRTLPACRFALIALHMIISFLFWWSMKVTRFYTLTLRILQFRQPYLDFRWPFFFLAELDSLPFRTSMDCLSIFYVVLGCPWNDLECRSKCDPSRTINARTRFLCRHSKKAKRLEVKSLHHGYAKGKERTTSRRTNDYVLSLLSRAAIDRRGNRRGHTRHSTSPLATEYRGSRGTTAS